MATTRDLAIDQGSYQEVELGPFPGPAGPYSLTGATARAQLRESKLAEQVLASFTTENGGIVLSASTGKATLKLDAGVTAAIIVAGGVWDLELVLADGKPRRVLQGKWTLDREVTR